MSSTNRTDRKTQTKLYLQLHGSGSRRSLRAWTEGGDVGVVGGGIYNAAGLYG